MVVSHDDVQVTEEDLLSTNVLLASNRAMGNGCIDYLTDIVYVKPEKFLSKDTPLIVSELETLNKQLVAENKKYLLIGFGRWGSSDPWLGIPVNWGQISGAKVLVEATLPDMDVELSQGSHFFHNITSFQVCCFSVHHAGPYKIAWDWLNNCEIINETEHVRHVRVASPLLIKVNGKNRLGVISHG